MAKRRLDLEIGGIDKGLGNLINQTKNKAINANKEVAKSVGGVAGDAAKQAQKIANIDDKGMIQVKGIDEIIGLMRELIDIVRNTSSQEIHNEKRLAEKQQQSEEASGLRKGKEEEKSRSVFQDIELAGLLTNATQAGRGIVTAGSANDFIGSGFQTAGSLIGGVANSFSGLPFVGTAIETAVGAIGDAIQQSTERRESLFQAEVAFRQQTGQGFATNNLSALRAGSPAGLANMDSRFGSLGLNREDIVKLAAEMATAQGRVAGQDQLLQSVAAQRSFGIGGGQIQEILKQGRFTEQGEILEELDKTLKNLQKEGIVTEKDRSLFTEIFQSQSKFVDFLSGSQESVSRSGALSTLLSFNRLGGAFGAKDPRSMGKIQDVVGGIASGGGEFQQALQIDALRKFTPGGNILDILEAQENIGQNPQQLKAIIDSVIQASGSKEAAIMEARSMAGFENLGIADLRRLFSGDFSAVGADDFKTDTQKMIASTEKLVSVLEQQNTEIQNAFIQSFSEGMATNMDVFGDRMAMAVEQAMADIAPKIEKSLTEALGFDVGKMLKDILGVLTDIKDFIKSISEFFKPSFWEDMGNAMSNPLRKNAPLTPEQVEKARKMFEASLTKNASPD